MVVRFVENRDSLSSICVSCQRCCKGEGFVRVSSTEAKAISSFLGMDQNDFISRYCKNNGRGLILKSKSNKDCIFLYEGGCQIYPARPRQCRTFPYKWKYEGADQECVLLRMQKERVSD